MNIGSEYNRSVFSGIQDNLPPPTTPGAPGAALGPLRWSRAPDARQYSTDCSEALPDGHGRRFQAGDYPPSFCTRLGERIRVNNSAVFWRRGCVLEARLCSGGAAVFWRRSRSWKNTASRLRSGPHSLRDDPPPLHAAAGARRRRKRGLRSGPPTCMTCILRERMRSAMVRPRDR